MTQSHKSERSHDILRSTRPVLDAMFAPEAVALVGATETAGSVGRTIFENLRASACSAGWHGVTIQSDEGAARDR